MNIQVTEQARRSLLLTRDYYNDELSGLGYEFVQEFLSAVERIQLYPEAWTPLSKRTRRCLVNRFPYSVIFRIVESKNEIQIIDLMHQKQKPKY
jgi:plasmid stabilization system protein ParE